MIVPVFSINGEAREARPEVTKLDGRDHRTGNASMVNTISLNIHALIDSYERRLETKIRAKAWGWLAEQPSFTFIGHALVVSSASWYGVT